MARAEIAVVYTARTFAAKFRMRLGRFGQLKRVLSGKRGCHDDKNSGLRIERGHELN